MTIRPPDRRCVIHFQYPEQPVADRRWRLVVAPDADVDLCSVDPGYDVDLIAVADLHTMTAIWMGHEPLRRALDDGRLKLTGDPAIGRSIEAWLALNPLSKVERMSA
jgi:hypothetical protein